MVSSSSSQPSPTTGLLGATLPSSFVKDVQNAGPGDLAIVKETSAIGSSSQLNERQKDQLEFIVRNPKCYFGNVERLEDCFDRSVVDGGLCYYTELVASTRDHDNLTTLHYWMATFGGGNPTGYVLICNRSSRKTWGVVLENCEGQIIWRGGGSSCEGLTSQDEAVKQFVRNFRSLCVPGTKNLDSSSSNEEEGEQGASSWQNEDAWQEQHGPRRTT